MKVVNVKTAFEAVGTESIETKMGVKVIKEYVYNVTGTIHCCLNTMQIATAANNGGQHVRYNIFKATEFNAKISGFV